MPIPATTTSAGRVSPVSSRTPVTRPSRVESPATEAPQRRVTPFRSCSRAQIDPSSGPSTRAIGVGSASKTVTSKPKPLHVDATSAPMNPPPTITTRAPGISSSRRASASSKVRRT